MKVVIISGGDPPSYSLISKELKEASYLICADSGANCLREYNISPDILMGDFDSIDEEVLNYFTNKGCEIIKYNPEKDYTDTEIAVNKAIELGCDEIVFLGCTGTRVDHVLGNLGMLLKCLRKNITSYIKDNNNIITITDKPIALYGEEGKTFSLAAYYNNVHNLTIIGAKYPLNKFYLEVGSPITISNEFLDEEVKISFDKGILLVIYSKD
ncbi:thiamine diphosphokinase [Clostridium sp. MB40-C1]|uniref:thiamine diphosphokinase n=1 Tax=Clostridium sp. MB40-C1 TaxID=3070996 RepID=UPI0027E1FFA5|nr:thiamine diphosphokinase [Clostridium sp. MB40-C1]WMJ82091.1 thiamine diphosphokinase [Clostridium sp. MB40-C1]